jgi:hypothetical protein
MHCHAQGLRQSTNWETVLSAMGTHHLGQVQATLVGLALALIPHVSLGSVWYVLHIIDTCLI